MSLLFNPDNLVEDEFFVEIRFSHQTGKLDRREVNDFLAPLLPHFMLKNFQEKPLLAQVASINGIVGQIFPDRITLSSSPSKVPLDVFISTAERFVRHAMEHFKFIYLGRAGLRIFNVQETSSIEEAAQSYKRAIQVAPLPADLGTVSGYNTVLQFKKDEYTATATIASAEKIQFVFGPSGKQKESSIKGIVFDIDVFIEPASDAEFFPKYFFPTAFNRYIYTREQLVKSIGIANNE